MALPCGQNPTTACGKVVSVFNSWFLVNTDERNIRVTSDLFYPKISLQHRAKLSNYLQRGDSVWIHNPDRHESEWTVEFAKVTFAESNKVWGIVEDVSYNVLKVWMPELGMIDLAKAQLEDSGKQNVWNASNLVGKRLQFYVNDPRAALAHASLVVDNLWKRPIKEPSPITVVKSPAPPSFYSNVSAQPNVQEVTANPPVQSQPNPPFSLLSNQQATSSSATTSLQPSSPEERVALGIVMSLRPDGFFLWSVGFPVLFCRFRELSLRMGWISQDFFAPFDVVQFTSTFSGSGRFNHGFNVLEIRHASSSNAVKNSVEHQALWKNVKLCTATVEEFVNEGRSCLLSRDKARTAEPDLYLSTSAFPCFVTVTKGNVWLKQNLRVLVAENFDWLTRRRKPWHALAILPYSVENIDTLIGMRSAERRQMMEDFAKSALECLKQRTSAGAKVSQTSDELVPVLCASASPPLNVTSPHLAQIQAQQVAAPVETASVPPNLPVDVSEDTTSSELSKCLGMVVGVAKDKGILWCAAFGSLEFSTTQAENSGANLSLQFQPCQTVEITVRPDSGENGTPENYVVAVVKVRREFEDIAWCLRVVNAKVTNVLHPSLALLDVVPRRDEIPFTIEADLSVLTAFGGQGTLPVVESFKEGNQVRVLICQNVEGSASYLFNATWKVLMAFNNPDIELKDVIEMNKKCSGVK